MEVGIRNIFTLGYKIKVHGPDLENERLFTRFTDPIPWYFIFSSRNIETLGLYKYNGYQNKHMVYDLKLDFIYYQ